MVPDFLNLKLCLVGYAFAGKKTQARKLKEEYGLEVFYLNDLVQEALAFYDPHPVEIILPSQQVQLIEQPEGDEVPER